LPYTFPDKYRMDHLGFSVSEREFPERAKDIHSYQETIYRGESIEGLDHYNWRRTYDPFYLVSPMFTGSNISSTYGFTADIHGIYDGSIITEGMIAAVKHNRIVRTTHRTDWPEYSPKYMFFLGEGEDPANKAGFYASSNQEEVYVGFSDDRRQRGMKRIESTPWEITFPLHIKGA
ncbi:MAG: hypothetical protein CEO21_360, partial [Microgenomates group bacterium Gr01-1014_80]